MNELLDFKRAARLHGVCGEWGGRWDAAESRGDLMNVALSAQGVEYIAAATAQGWGLSQEYFKREFASYINGLWQRKADGYTSELYVGHSGAVEQRSTLTLMLGCHCTFHVPKKGVAQLYLCGGSDVTVVNDGYCAVYVYGDGNTFRTEGRGVHSRYLFCD